MGRLFHSLLRMQWLFQVNNCRAPAAKLFASEMERFHIRMFFQNGVNRPAQLPDAFSVDDPHAQNPSRPTLREIFQHETLHFTRLKRVQVQHAVNGHSDGFFVHEFIQARILDGTKIKIGLDGFCPTGCARLRAELAERDCV